MAEKFDELHAEGVTDLVSYRLGLLAERERIIGLMLTHGVKVNPFTMRLHCLKCGDITHEKPSHLMNLIDSGAK